MSLPERVNAMRVVTYDPQEVKDSLIEMNFGGDFSDQEVLDLIAEWAVEDLGTTDFILQDQDGEEL